MLPGDATAFLMVPPLPAAGNYETTSNSDNHLTLHIWYLVNGIFITSFVVISYLDDQSAVEWHARHTTTTTKNRGKVRLQQQFRTLRYDRGLPVHK